MTCSVKWASCTLLWACFHSGSWWNWTSSRITKRFHLSSLLCSLGSVCLDSFGEKDCEYHPGSMGECHDPLAMSAMGKEKRSGESFISRPHAPGGVFYSILWDFKSDVSAAWSTRPGIKMSSKLGNLHRASHFTKSFHGHFLIRT